MKNELKQKLLQALIKLDNFYVKLNLQLSGIWKVFLDKQSENRLTKGLLVLLKNPATALFLNTVLLSVIGLVLGSIFSETINNFIKLFISLNILVFCARILGWKDKLNK